MIHPENRRPAIVLRQTLIMTLALVFILGAGISSSLAASGPTAAQYGVVLNLSGKQRMLSQKLSKEMLLIAMDVEKADNLKNLEATAALFDKTLSGLRDGNIGMSLPPTTKAEIVKQLDKIRRIWKPFYVDVRKTLSTGKATSTQVSKLAVKSPILLREMNKCVTMYEKDAALAGLKSDPSLAVTINLSGKQRMLTQKMSKEVLLVALGYETDRTKQELVGTYTLFERTLKGLMDGDKKLKLPGTTNPTIRKQLRVVEELWEAFKPSVLHATDPGTAFIPRKWIAKLAAENMPLLREMNKAVGMYEKEAAKK